MRLGDPGRDRADPGRADQFDAHPRARVDHLEVVDELRQILDRIDVVVRRRRDQRDAGRRVAQLGDELGDLEAGQLPALAGLGALRDLDLDLVAGVQIFRGHAEAPRGDLLDHRVRIIAVVARIIALGILAAFARDRLGADPVHRDRQRLVRLGAERAERHSGGHEALADLRDRLDLVDRHALRGEVELKQVAQIDRWHVAHAARELEVGRIAVVRHCALQQVHELRRIGVGLAAVALAVEAADRKRDHCAVERGIVAQLGVEMERGIALARYLRRHPGEEIVDQRAAEAHRLEIIAAAVRRDHRDPHLREDLEQPLVDRLAVAREALLGGERAEQPARLAVEDRRLGEIGVHRGRADADQHRIIMRVEAFGGAHVDAGERAQSLAHQMRVDRRRREHPGDRDPIGTDMLVGEEDLGTAGAHRLFGLEADAGDRGAERFGPLARGEGAIDLGALIAEMRLEPLPIAAGQHRACRAPARAPACRRRRGCWRDCRTAS